MLEAAQYHCKFVSRQPTGYGSFGQRSRDPLRDELQARVTRAMTEGGVDILETIDVQAE